MSLQAVVLAGVSIADSGSAQRQLRTRHSPRRGRLWLLDLLDPLAHHLYAPCSRARQLCAGPGGGSSRRSRQRMRDWCVTVTAAKGKGVLTRSMGVVSRPMYPCRLLLRALCESRSAPAAGCPVSGPGHLVWSVARGCARRCTTPQHASWACSGRHCPGSSTICEAKPSRSAPVDDWEQHLHAAPCSQL